MVGSVNVSCQSCLKETNILVLSDKKERIGIANISFMDK